MSWDDLADLSWRDFMSVYRQSNAYDFWTFAFRQIKNPLLGFRLGLNRRMIQFHATDASDRYFDVHSNYPIHKSENDVVIIIPYFDRRRATVVFMVCEMPYCVRLGRRKATLPGRAAQVSSVLKKMILNIMQIFPEFSTIK